MIFLSFYIDFNECKTPNIGGCDFHAGCINTVGGFYCGECPTGYSGRGNETCVRKLKEKKTKMKKKEETRKERNRRKERKRIASKDGNSC